jgi:SAM-dependent methyltransferase
MPAAPRSHPPAPPIEAPIPYGDAMRRLVEGLHAGSEDLPAYADWIREHLGGRVLAFRERLLPQLLFFTDLHDRDLLDFGCGTGSTTVALCERAPGSRITAVDIEPELLRVARLRLQHHGMEARVVLQHIAPVQRRGDLPFASASFDVVLANGVLEHVVPLAVRPQVVLEMWRLLRPGGVLFISETPNALWPIDRHTTGLPLVPWLPSGVAARLAVAAGRHRREWDLDARGRRGMTFWEIVRPLRQAGERYEVLNVTRAGNRLRPVAIGAASRRRRLGRLVIEGLLGKPLGALGVPTVALAPFLEYLCLRKRAAWGS